MEVDRADSCFLGCENGGGHLALVIVWGHVGRPIRVGEEYQRVRIIADSILSALKKKPLLQHLWPHLLLMKMKFYDPSSSLTAGLLMSLQQGGGWIDEEKG